MKISAVIVNHNSEDTVLTVIESLLDQRVDFDQVIVVDNGSSDASTQKIMQRFPSVKMVELGQNTGLSAARNIGLKLVKSPLALSIDDDVYLAKGSLQKLIDAQRESGAAIVCPRIVLFPKNDTIQFDGTAIHFVGTLSLNHAYQPVDAHPPTRRSAAGFGGACLLIDMNRMAGIGGFDEDFFFYFEDMELSYRTLSLGHSICCEERAVVMHNLGGGTENLSFRGAGSYPARRAYFTLRNRWLTIAIHYQLRTLILLSPALMLYELAAFAESLRRGWLGEYIRAMVSLWTIAPRIVAKRRRQQTQRSVPDRMILTGGDLPFARGFVSEGTAGLVRALNWILNSYWEWVKRWL